MPDIRTQEIASEQKIVDRVYARVEEMREQARQLEKEGYDRSYSGPVAGLVERDALVHRAGKQLKALDAEAEGLVFGRLDFTDGDVYYIGRLGVRDEDRQPMLIDWRAPAAAPFYRATPGEPLDVVRRRVILCRGEQVIGVDDDLLVPDEAGKLGVVGEGALLAALQRSRGPVMRDIVTTIQKEQDEAIRAPARGVTLITGGPGTGKTQVALHRAAYLLYTERGKFAEGGVLVIGPSTVFTNYIGRVLPALGEDSVHLRALGELAGGITATRRDRPEVAEVKGSEAMAELLADLVWQTPPGAPQRLRHVYEGQVLTLEANELAAARERVRAMGAPPNESRELAATVLLDALWEKTDGVDKDKFKEDVNDRNDFVAFLRRWWPRLTPTQVLFWLSERGPDVVAKSYQDNPEWTVDDVPLLDELSVLLGRPPAPPKPQDTGWRIQELTSGPKTSEHFAVSFNSHDGWVLYAPGHPTPIALAGNWIESDASGAVQRWAEAVILREGHKVARWTEGLDPYGEEAHVPILTEPLPVDEPEEESIQDSYAHVILDEAQDLSPMECRMIARRSEYASMTIVGDLGQATHPLASKTWSDLLNRLKRRESRSLELNTGYRVPQTIADYATRFLAPWVAPTHSYRMGGELSIQDTDDIKAAVQQAISEVPQGATFAVVAADSMVEKLGPIPELLPASLVKGLEFDHVIVVEPREIVQAEPRGYNRLYVVLTRAVASLRIIHREPLPDPLR